jgi:hypothetical protein
MAKLGLDAKALVENVETLMGKKLKIAEEDLAKARTVSVHSSAKVEGL